MNATTTSMTVNITEVEFDDSEGGSMNLWIGVMMILMMEIIRSDTSWTDNESEDNVADIVFDDSDDDWGGDDGLYDVEINSKKDCRDFDGNIQMEHINVEANDSRAKEKKIVRFRDETDGYDNDEFLGLPISDEEEDVPLKNFPLHKQLKNMSEYKWQVETLFVSRDQFKDCATSYAIHNEESCYNKHTCNKNSWTWFLHHLCDDLGVDKIRHYPFMSDQQKGLIPTFDEFLPGVDHRFCARHLYSNFKKRFLEVQLKLMMWYAVKTTYV
ncbi:hypothetical protein Ahy_B07g087827 [Arachis hypogaea]|uniref:MULE transposase domain-containing protein n=1 Tax=Arachis hypogaea TaxID=3818 RepID=A0A444YD33_ARAHY|nr:hypothetical protein Ahy_B07g087827 [Arachis hypogaea]